MVKKQLSFSILIPVYKGSLYLKQSLESITRQKFPYLEIVVVDDNNPLDKDEIESTKKILNELSHLPNSKIRYYKNNINLGSQGTIKKLASLAKGDILFYLCQDDILLNGALKKTNDAFFLAKDIGAVTRPFFWFDDDVSKPLRAVLPPDRQNDTILSLFEGEEAVKSIFGSVGQISGLAYRKNFIQTPFHLDIFPGHIYPFAGILKRHKCVFLKDFTVAVRIKSSQSRQISSIYNTSPLASWIKMFNSVYKERKYDHVRRQGINHIATHYEGLVQIKNFGPKGAVEREIKLHIKYYWPSIFQPKFWFFVFITLLLPRRLLLPLSDTFKRVFLSKNISITTNHRR